MRENKVDIKITHSTYGLIHVVLEELPDKKVKITWLVQEHDTQLYNKSVLHNVTVEGITFCPGRANGGYGPSQEYRSDHKVWLVYQPVPKEKPMELPASCVIDFCSFETYCALIKAWYAKYLPDAVVTITKEEGSKIGEHAYVW